MRRDDSLMQAGSYGTRAPRLATAVTIMALAAGCAAPMGPLPEATVRQTSQRACARADWFASDRAARRVDAASLPQAAAPGVRSVTGFSAWAVEVADTIGALPLLQRVPDLEAGAASDRDAELALLHVRQALTERVLLAMLEVSGVLAEVECESERGNQLRDRLQRAEEARARRLSLASILIGATTAILSGGLALTHPELVAGSVVGTLGGTAEAAAGLSLQFGSRTGELHTDRNLLREVWEGPERSTLLPLLVWRFLMRPARDDADARTVRQKLLDEWRADGRLGAPGSQAERDRIALLLGARGAFTVEDLLVRDAMLDLLQADVALIHQDLALLLRELMARPRGGPVR